MLKLALTAAGMVLLFGSGLLFVERKRNWLLAGGLLVVAGILLTIAKGLPWLVLTLAGLGALGYALHRLDTPVKKEPK